MKNVELAKGTIELLAQVGVREIVLCSGSRNSPFIALACAQQSLFIWRHFSEAAAGYFALGRVKATARPVAVVVTSGTAAVQLAPALAEAYYSSLPLIALTADRPRRFRGTGAPQSIFQRDLFGENIGTSFDLDSSSTLPLISDVQEALNSRGPLHINACFEEPLIDSELGDWNPSLGEWVATDRETGSDLSEFWGRTRHPLVIVGELSDRARPLVGDFLERTGFEVFLEPLSGLRECSELQELALRSLVKDDVVKQEYDAVIRIGGVPASSIWRDLERDERMKRLPVISLAENEFSGLARESKLVRLSRAVLMLPERAIARQVRNMEIPDRYTDRFREFPRSEQSFYYHLSLHIERDALVYLGNSNPIRFWSAYADRSANDRVYRGNRGANGIDGQLSTFFGCCEAERPNWAILGDLTLLYDLEAAYVVAQLSEKLSFRIVVVNNNGGRLFEYLPDYQRHFKDTVATEVFIQPHRAQFRAVADLWGLEYRRCTSIEEFQALPHRALIEIVVDNEQSAHFASWKE